MIITKLVTPAAIADNEIVAAPGVGKEIVVVRYVLSASGGANTATFKSAAVAIGPALVLGANEKFGEGGTARNVPLLRCAGNAALNLALTAATAVGCQLSYYIE